MKALLVARVGKRTPMPANEVAQAVMHIKLIYHGKIEPHAYRTQETTRREKRLIDRTRNGEPPPEKGVFIPAIMRNRETRHVLDLPLYSK